MLRVIRETLQLSRLSRQLQPTDELGVALVDRTTITALNEACLGHPGATDVITFDYRTAGEFGANDALVGEIYVCLDVAADVNGKHGSSFAEEVLLYIIHGILHLAGFRDDTDSERRKIREAENRIMESLRAAYPLEHIFVQ